MHRFKRNIDKRFEEIQTLLEKPRRQFTPSTFHKLRVNIKKLTAALKLINAVSDEFKLNKTIRPYEAIFKQAGKIRDLQIEESLLKKHFEKYGLKSFRYILTAEKTAEKNLFFLMINEETLARIKKQHDKAISVIYKSDKATILNFMAERLALLRTLLNNQNLNKADLHALRKKLKNHTYNLRSLEKEGEINQLPETDKLMELLGKWHDYQSTLNHIKSINSTGLFNKKETLILKNIQNTFASEVKALQQQIKIVIPHSELLE